LRGRPEAIRFSYARYLRGVLDVFATGVRWFFVGVAALAIVTVIFLVITDMLGVGNTGG